MLEEFSTVKVEPLNGWPDKICIQCVHQISRCHSFKRKIEKSDEQLRQYIKSITIVVEEPTIKEQQRVPDIKSQMQPTIQEIQIQRPENSMQQAHPLIITNVLNNPTSHMINGQHHQLIQTPNGIIQAQIGQFLQGPNNTIQMITSPTNVHHPQVLQLRTDSDNRCELIVQPSEVTETQFYDDVPVVVQSANGQQTILNLPHHQVQQLQQQMNNNQQETIAQYQEQMTERSEPDEIEIHEVQEFDDDYACEDMEEIVEEEPESDQQQSSEQVTYYVETMEENSETDQDADDKQLLAEFLTQQTHSEGPGKHFCNLCQQEFRHVKWLHSHMKSIHINWIKANCKKQPQCSICRKSFRGPGMLKMHMKTHEKEDKLPTCSICSKEFRTKSILYRHRATHFEQKKHQCSFCSKSFNSNYQLNAHVQRHQRNQHNETDGKVS